MLDGLLNFLLPPRCLHCRTHVAAADSLCADCWSGLDFISAPVCQRCGLRFEIAVGGVELCAACIKDPPVYDWCRTALMYGDISRALMLTFKHQRRTSHARFFAQLMAALIPPGPAVGRTALLLPIPLHPSRLRRRRFNQAQLLAENLAARGYGVVAADLVVRRRATVSQGTLGRSGRARNVAHAFALAPSAKERIAGKTIILVDDVFTTGATLEAVARVVTRARPATIGALCAARAKGNR